VHGKQATASEAIMCNGLCAPSAPNTVNRTLCSIKQLAGKLADIKSG